MKDFKTIRQERITKEEAIKIMQDDKSGSMIDMHKGFFCDGPYPFIPPQHRGTVIIWPPVGRTTTESRPDRTASMDSAWRGRKVS